MIRPLKQEDFPAVLKLETELFTSPWPEKEFQYELSENPFAHLLVDEEDGVIAGYCDWWQLYDQAQVANIAVAGEYQKQGIGSKLMERMIFEAVQAGCENLSLEVRVSNAGAIALYEKYEFIRANVRKNYYDDPREDAYLMVKPLGGLENDENTGD